MYSCKIVRCLGIGPGAVTVSSSDENTSRRKALMIHLQHLNDGRLISFSLTITTLKTICSTCYFLDKTTATLTTTLAASCPPTLSSAASRGYCGQRPRGGRWLRQLSLMFRCGGCFSWRWHPSPSSAGMPRPLDGDGGGLCRSPAVGVVWRWWWHEGQGSNPVWW